MSAVLSLPLSLREISPAPYRHRPQPGPGSRFARSTDGGAVDLASALEIVLDRCSDGVLIIDGQARVLHANRRARELLRRARDDAHGTGVLAFADAATDRAFRLALRRPAPEDDCCDADHGGIRRFLVRARCGTLLARGTIEPLHRRQRPVWNLDLVPPRSEPVPTAVTWCVTLHPQPSLADIDTEALSDLYGLSAAEARLAGAVLSSSGVDGLAQCCGLSRNTVKTHLRQIFRKCNVEGLTELAALLGTGPRHR
jgi:DNA-binding CsgD family transcriptional regulator